jgi:stress response protein YsnF
MSPDDKPNRDDLSNKDQKVIPIVEEVATVDILKRTTGRTRVSTRTKVTSTPIDENLETYGVDVTRVHIGKDLGRDEAIPTTREEGDTTIIPVFEEYLVVEKRLRLVEEVHIRRTTESEAVHFSVDQKRQVAEVEHEDFGTNKTKPETE